MLTRKMLQDMGLTEEQVETIVQANADSIDGLKKKLSAAEAKAESAETLQKKLDEIKARGQSEYEAKIEEIRKEFEAFKSDVTAKEAKAAREKAARAYFESKKITGKGLSLAMRGAQSEISAIELDESGRIKDTSTLDALIEGDFSDLVVKTSTRGASTATPPNQTSGSGAKTKEEILEIKDDSARKAEWAKYLAAKMSQKG